MSLLDFPCYPQVFARGASELRWSPDGTKLAFISFDEDGDNCTSNYRVRVVDVDTGGVIFASETDGMAVSLDWHSDNRHLVVGDFLGKVRVVDIQTGRLLHEFTAFSPQEVLLFSFSQAIWSVSWNPSGDRLAVASRSTLLHIVTPSGELLNSYDFLEDAILWAGWSPDGKKIGVTRVGQGLVLLDAETLEIVPVLKREAKGSGVGAWSPDGKQIGFATNHGSVEIWDMETGLLKQGISVYPKEIVEMSWSPDGQFIATAAPELPGKAWIWYLPTRTMIEEIQLENDYRIRCVDWSSSGRLAYGLKLESWMLDNGRNEFLDTDLPIKIEPERFVLLD